MSLFNGAEGLEFLRDKIMVSQQFISIITRIELFAWDNLTPDDEKYISLFLQNRSVIQITEDVELNAITLRRKTSLKLPDTIIAATALSLGAVVITLDPHLLNLKWPGLQVVSSV
jgi:predicted nucleic acid-binding protein